MTLFYAALASQCILVAYHQATTWIDLYPFNGVRNYTSNERFIEAGVNAVLMGLPIIGFAGRIHSLMTFGAVYYPVLFGLELTIWWFPYFFVPRGMERRIYNIILSLATSNFGPKDTLAEWLAIYRRIYPSTIIVLPPKDGRIVPNLEHMILHGWTLLTAALTLAVYRTL